MNTCEKVQPDCDYDTNWQNIYIYIYIYIYMCVYNIQYECLLREFHE
jgi:hypothetical protein